MGSVLRLLAGLWLASLLASCGGGGGAAPPAPASAAAAISSQPADQSVVAGTTATFTVVASAATAYEWQRSTDGGASFTAIAGATTAAYTLPVASLADSGTRYRVVVSGAANSVTSTAATLNVTAAVVAPSISVQPADRSVTAGQDASFSVTATGSNLAYRWQGSPDGVAFSDLPGATQANLTLPAVPLTASSSRVRVVVSNTAGSVTSTAAVLTVTAAPAVPAFTTQPASATVVAPAGATFTAVATGVPAPTLQWQRSTDGGASFADIAGATGTSFVVSATASGDPVSIYRVVATNTAGSATSNAATLTVDAAPQAPTFTTQPVSASIVAGQSTQFTVAVTGTPTPTLQWQLSTDGGASWGNINGATGNTFDVINAAQANDGRQFRAVASNSAGSVNSNAAVLTVTAANPGAPVFTTQPADVETTSTSQSARFVVAASGAPTPTLQWQSSTNGGSSWNDLPGETGFVLNVPAVNGNQYRAVASNTAGVVNSNPARVTIRLSTSFPFQFNLFAFNSGPAAFLLYGGAVRDNLGLIECSGYVDALDRCPKWRTMVPSGTTMTLTATPWPQWRVAGWSGGDCGSPGTATSATLVIDHNSNCFPKFELVPGTTFSVSVALAGPWVGSVVHVVVDRFGQLVVPDAPLILCGPEAGAQVCIADVAAGSSPFTVIRLKANPLSNAPPGVFRWTCQGPFPDDPSAAPVVFSVASADVAIGPIFGNTACSVELVPTP